MPALQPAFAPAASGADGLQPLMHASVYQELRRRFVTGAITPDSSLSTRGLALELGVSQTPVREALSRLAAEGAVQIRSKRRVGIPPMTRARFDDLLRCRLLLEPESARLALDHVDAARLRDLYTIDAGVDAALSSGDVAAYMQGNVAFHFTLYAAHPHTTLNALIETLWLQFGPHMRVVYDRCRAPDLVDRHQETLQAIERRDARAIVQAIRDDIGEGMGLIAREVLQGTG